jgi:hypothetical protein
VEAGEAAGGAVWPAAGAGKGGGAALEVGDEPDRWAPPVGEREREERGGGRWRAGVGRKRALGRGVGWVG